MAVSCTGNNSSDPAREEAIGVVTPAPSSTATQEIPLVSLATATAGSLPLRRQATGQLRARREIIVRARQGGPVLTAPLEGNYYGKGDLLLSVDPQPLQLARDRAAAARDEAAFRQRDLQLRIEANLAPGDTSVTDLARENILIQSGLPAAEVALAEAEFQLGLTRLSAPFAGRAADVKVQPGEQVAIGEEVCTLVDLGSLEAEFRLLEQELPGLRQRGTVYVSPVARPELRLSATLDIVNPRVEEGGLLRVRARLRNYRKADLYPGMNVTVTLEGRSPPAVLVPKAAVVLRSGRTLVFVYDADSGRAKWEYVTVVAENDEAVAISEGVTAGQRVIVGGNLTLDHDSPVRVE
ncbi:MAG: efflux RND transporter periplasmic adaptor subunit [Bacteroidota bacterium]